MNGSKVK